MSTDVTMQTEDPFTIAGEADNWISNDATPGTVVHVRTGASLTFDELIAFLDGTQIARVICICTMLWLGTSIASSARTSATSPPAIPDCRPGLRSVTITGAPPSVFHSSKPCTPSSGVK